MHKWNFLPIFFFVYTVKHRTDFHTVGLTIHGQVRIPILYHSPFLAFIFYLLITLLLIDWLGTGHKRIPQPDNAEYDINRTPEACLAVLNNVYNDGIWWHDVACYHEKPVVCEDNPELLNYICE